MPVKTHEIQINVRATNTTLASAVSGATFTVDSIAINGVDVAESVVLSGGEMTTLTAAIKAAIVAALT